MRASYAETLYLLMWPQLSQWPEFQADGGPVRGHQDGG
jgi:hypothetical protein